ncbi:putative transmembrane protein [Cryptosporidium felis]|nr:putative transmembrane protein [Cryptosporidium felis]
MQLDSFDTNLTENEKEKKMTFCFELTQKEFIEKRSVYQKIAMSIKNNEQISPNDALRALFHQNLVTCYFNSDIREINSVLNEEISKEKLVKFFTANEKTPMKFSSNQLKVLENIISSSANKAMKNTDRNPSKKSKGFYGYLYFVLALFFIGFSFYYTVNSLNKNIKKNKNK